MDPLDAPKTTLMSNNWNYYYNVMPFRLKNTRAINQRLMEGLFFGQIGCTLEVHIRDMVVKTLEK